MAIPLVDILKLVGTLDDSTGDENARSRFRAYLQESVAKPGSLRDYIQSCLSNSGDQYNRALQDLINRAGELLGFTVAYGRYKGVQGEIGHDGLWSSPTGLFVVAEVKTTDAFSIDTATLLGYVDKLISAQKIPDRDHALGLYVIARPDLGLSQLESSIIAKKLADQLRVISAESLLKVTELACEYGIEHEKLLMLIRPSGPRLDSVIDLMAELIAQEKLGPENLSNDSHQPSAGTQAPKEPKTVLAYSDGPPEAAQYFLVPVGAEREETAAQVVERTVGHDWFAFGERTPHKDAIKTGDFLCFYASGGFGVIATARVANPPHKDPQFPGLTKPSRWSWVVNLDNAKLFLNSPITINREMRARLDAFKEKDLDAAWGWFVVSVHKVSQRDFDLLTQVSDAESK